MSRSTTGATRSGERVALRSAAGRWIIAAGVLGSVAAFLQMTVVNVAVPAIAMGLGAGVAGVQWVLNGYLLTLSALMLLGGALGDSYGTARVYSAGLLLFALSSGLAALMPTPAALVGARLLQGAAGALIVPNSLALIDRAFVEDERGPAIGQWAAWSAVASAVAPLLGGWLVEAASWRWVFALATPLALTAAWIMRFRILPTEPTAASGRLDVAGAALATGALASLSALLIFAPGGGLGDLAATALGGAAAALGVAFVRRERSVPDPLLPLRLFRSRQFTGANAATLLIYAALSGTFLFLVLHLQSVLGYSAVHAGAALVPVSLLMMAISPAAGRAAQRHGPRLPVAAGALTAAAGLVLLARITSGTSYALGILPAIAIFGFGLSWIVAPLTSAVLASVPDGDSAMAAAVNNAVARTAGLLAVAALPGLVGLHPEVSLEGAALAAGFPAAMLVSAALCAAAAAIAFLTLEHGAHIAEAAHPGPEFGCSQCRALPQDADPRGRR